METLHLARDLVDKITPDKTTEALSKFGGKVLKTSMTKDPRSSFKRRFTAPITVRALRSQAARSSHRTTA